MARPLDRPASGLRPALLWGLGLCAGRPGKPPGGLRRAAGRGWVPAPHGVTGRGTRSPCAPRPARCPRVLTRFLRSRLPQGSSCPPAPGPPPARAGHAALGGQRGAGLRAGAPGQQLCAGPSGASHPVLTVGKGRRRQGLHQARESRAGRGRGMRLAPAAPPWDSVLLAPWGSTPGPSSGPERARARPAPRGSFQVGGWSQ